MCAKRVTLVSDIDKKPSPEVCVADSRQAISRDVWCRLWDSKVKGGKSSQSLCRLERAEMKVELMEWGTTQALQGQRHVQGTGLYGCLRSPFRIQLDLPRSRWRRGSHGQSWTQGWIHPATFCLRSELTPGHSLQLGSSLPWLRGRQRDSKAKGGLVTLTSQDQFCSSAPEWEKLQVCRPLSLPAGVNLLTS